MHLPREKRIVQGMKCRSLRRRYIVFELIGEAEDSTIARVITSLAPESTMTRLIRREGRYIIARFDHLTARGIKSKSPIPLGQENAEIRSILTVGTVMKAREKIKKLLRKHYPGDEEAVPVKQNNKMLIK
jgi:hypothetical protein